MIDNTSTVTEKVTLDEMILGFPHWHELIRIIRNEKDPLIQGHLFEALGKGIDLYTESLKDLKTVRGAGDLYAKVLNESYKQNSQK